MSWDGTFQSHRRVANRADIIGHWPGCVVGTEWYAGPSHEGDWDNSICHESYFGIETDQEVLAHLSAPQGQAKS
jgi:hypothetical protein